MTNLFLTFRNLQKDPSAEIPLDILHFFCSYTRFRQEFATWLETNAYQPTINLAPSAERWVRSLSPHFTPKDLLALLGPDTTAWLKKAPSERAIILETLRLWRSPRDPGAFDDKGRLIPLASMDIYRKDFTQWANGFKHPTTLPMRKIYADWFSYAFPQAPPLPPDEPLKVHMTFVLGPTLGAVLSSHQRFDRTKIYELVCDLAWDQPTPTPVSRHHLRTI